MIRLAALLALLLGGCASSQPLQPTSIHVSGDDRGIGGTGAPRAGSRGGTAASTSSRDGTADPTATSAPPATPPNDADQPKAPTKPK